MTYHAKITSKGQITIPIDVRRALGLKDGDTVALDVDGGVATMTPKRRKSFDDLLGIGRPFIRDPSALGLPWKEIMRRTNDARAAEYAKEYGVKFDDTDAA